MFQAWKNLRVEQRRTKFDIFEKEFIEDAIRTFLQTCRHPVLRRFETFTFSAARGYVIGPGSCSKNPVTSKNQERGRGWMSRQWFFDSTIELAGFLSSICINAEECSRR